MLDFAAPQHCIEPDCHRLAVFGPAHLIGRGRPQHCVPHRCAGEVGDVPVVKTTMLGRYARYARYAYSRLQHMNAPGAPVDASTPLLLGMGDAH